MNSSLKYNMRDNSDIKQNKESGCQCGQEIINNLNNYINNHPECTVYQN